MNQRSINRIGNRSAHLGVLLVLVGFLLPIATAERVFVMIAGAAIGIGGASIAYLLGRWQRRCARD